MVAASRRFGHNDSPMQTSNPFDVSGRRILITGASGGLGEHFARLLAGRGATAILAARRTERCEAIASDIRRAGGQAETVALDVGSTASVEAAFEKIALPDVVVNNAGISRGGFLDTLSDDEWHDVINTNVSGVMRTSRAAIQRWKAAHRGGVIVNVASILGLRVIQALPAYNASKAAVVQLTRSLALDSARYDIRVNCLCPGYYATDINRDFLSSEPGEKMRKRIPMRRFGEYHNLDGAMLLLVSDASAYMTGTEIAVDGGHLVSTL